MFEASLSFKITRYTQCGKIFILKIFRENSVIQISRNFHTVRATYLVVNTYVTALPKPGQNFELFSTLTGHGQVEPQIADNEIKNTAWKNLKFTLTKKIS